MQKVFQKQESTEEMFHRRQASLRKLAARQARPVQPVAPRPEALSKSPCPSPGPRGTQGGAVSQLTGNTLTGTLTHSNNTHLQTHKHHTLHTSTFAYAHRHTFTQSHSHIILTQMPAHTHSHTHTLIYTNTHSPDT